MLIPYFAATVCFYALCFDVSWTQHLSKPVQAAIVKVWLFSGAGLIVLVMVHGVVQLIEGVRRDRRARAARERELDLMRGVCPACGYDTRGLLQARCPECGEGLEDGAGADVMDGAGAADPRPAA